MHQILIMEGRKLFDYDKEDVKEKNNESGKKAMNIVLKTIQVILSVIMAILHL